MHMTCKGMLFETQYPDRVCCTSNYRGKIVLDLAGLAMQHLFMMHVLFEPVHEITNNVAF